MNVMRHAVRSSFAALVPVLLLIPAAAVGGCSADGEQVVGSGPTVTATGPEAAPSSAPSSAPSPAQSSEDVDTSSPSGPRDRLAAVCGPYVVMVRAIKNAGFSGADPDQVAAGLAPVMKEFAASLPKLRRPPGMPVAVWRGIEALAAQILALPDRPTYAQIEAVEGELDEQEHDDVDAAAAWFRTTCPV